MTTRSVGPIRRRCPEYDPVMFPRRWLSLLLWMGAAVGLSEAWVLAQSVESTPPTFRQDVAPLLWDRCGSCHRPEQSAPFSLLTYADARRRGSQIVEVTQSGYMPPWLPDAPVGAFKGDRSLSAAQRRILKQWYDAGMPEGEGPMPPRPTWPEGWALGEPDLILSPEAPFELVGEGADAFRNFVIENPSPELRAVRAIELLPGSQAVHHAVIQVDRSTDCRDRDARDEGPGFDGMDMGRSMPPDWHFLGWTPGNFPEPLPDDMGWRFYPDADLVLQVHLIRTGRRELIQPRLGIHWADRLPSRVPYSIVLHRTDIDIPAGDAAHSIRDRYLLPTDVEVVSIYPHAHYLGRSVTGTARRPDGSTIELIRIDRWDFNWQDEYRYREPIRLPKGTELTMVWTYDNTAGNVRNPHDPPRRVRFGPQSSDEMGSLSIQVIPADATGLRALRRQWWTHLVEKIPWDVEGWNMLATFAIEDGDLRTGLELVNKALSLDGSSADALSNLALVHLMNRRADEAIQVLRRALATTPDHSGANARLVSALARSGRLSEALAHADQVVKRWPHFHQTHFEVGNSLAMAGRPSEAIPHYRRAIELNPAVPEVHNNLANALFASNRLEEASREYEQALELKPDYFNARFNLGRCLLARGEKASALSHLSQAAQLRPDDPGVAAALEQARTP